jgi:glycosyltransferase involved in cell wall biosynthesis
VIWFVTPAHGRFELTRICLEQRQHVIEELARHSIHAECVVVADDENLDTARALGMHTVEQNNEWLGRKFNDGIEYAAKRGEWIVPIGSDSWIDPAYLVPLPDPQATRSAGMYAAVTADRIGYLDVRNPRNPAGPHMIHRSRLPESLRPARDELSRYIDSSTLAGLSSVRWEIRDLHPLQYIGFRGQPHITPYDRLYRAWGVRESTDPWTELATVYPPELVDRARACLSSTSAAEPIPAETASAPSGHSTA